MSIMANISNVKIAALNVKSAQLILAQVIAKARKRVA